MSLIRITRNPPGRQLLVFALAWAVFLGSIGLADWHHGRPRAAETLWAAALLLPLTALVSLKPLRWAFVGLSYITYPIGMVVSHIALAVVYFLVLMPIGLVMRILGRDPLTRRFDPDQKSYWLKRPASRPPESYFKQN
ncbi:MAG TPA: SxtJ family membrane protein [Opitutaceae bacterium]|jgi:hypothetical protein|nr:SxtJ family membrane protein [Opitutaceae bacterium]